MVKVVTVAEEHASMVQALHVPKEHGTGLLNSKPFCLPSIPVLEPPPPIPRWMPPLGLQALVA
jgi:hypothetical protein